jgi:hypothetical protein
MKIKQIQALEGYFKTENNHWNEFVLEMLCKVLQEGIFANPELPLKLLRIGTNIFVDKHETPLQAVYLFARELGRKKLSTNQKLFLYKWAWKYLDETEYEKLDLESIKDLLESQEEKLKAEFKLQKPQEKNISETIKEIMKKEFEQLPETLKKLEPVQRLTIICKLAPYILPKIEVVNSEFEAKGFSW